MTLRCLRDWALSRTTPSQWKKNIVEHLKKCHNRYCLWINSIKRPEKGLLTQTAWDWKISWHCSFWRKLSCTQYSILLLLLARKKWYFTSLYLTYILPRNTRTINEQPKCFPVNFAYPYVSDIAQFFFAWNKILRKFLLNVLLVSSLLSKTLFRF